MKQFLKFLTKLKGFWKIYSGYGYDGETVEFIIENYTKVLCNRTSIMSYPTYYARDVIAQIDDWFEKKGYVHIERQDKPKYNYDKFKTALSTEELAFLIWDLDFVKDCRLEDIEEYLEKKVEE